MLNTKKEEIKAKKIAFGGGCHWCTEAVFQHVAGVLQVDQGWASSHPPDDELSEAVLVHYDESVSIEKLTEVHLATHSSSSQHAMRKKYRSAVYFLDLQTETRAKTYIDSLGKQIITRVLPLMAFEKNVEHYLDYYKKNPEAQFCQRYIQPKLQRVKEILNTN